MCVRECVCVCACVCACVMLIRGSGSRGEKQAGRGHAGAGGNLRGVLSPEAGAPGATRRVRLWTEPTSSACTWNVLAPPPSSPNVLPSAPASLRTIPSIPRAHNVTQGRPAHPLARARERATGGPLLRAHCALRVDSVRGTGQCPRLRGCACTASSMRVNTAARGCCECHAMPCHAMPCRPSAWRRGKTDRTSLDAHAEPPMVTYTATSGTTWHCAMVSDRVYTCGLPSPVAYCEYSSTPAACRPPAPPKIGASRA